MFVLLTSSVWPQLPPSPSETRGSVLSPLCTSLSFPVWTYCLKAPIPQSPGPPTGSPGNTPNKIYNTHIHKLTHTVYKHNTVRPSRFMNKLSTLCDRVLNFLTCRPPTARMGSHTSRIITVNTGTPLQNCRAACQSPGWLSLLFSYLCVGQLPGVCLVICLWVGYLVVVQLCICRSVTSLWVSYQVVVQLTVSESVTWWFSTTGCCVNQMFRQ